MSERIFELMTIPLRALKLLLHWAFFVCCPVLFRVLRRIRSAPFSSSAVERIVLLRTGSIGDMVTFLPTIRALRQALPSAKLTLVTSAVGAEIVSEEDLVAEILVCSLYDFLRMNVLQRTKLILGMRRRKPDLFVASTQELDVWFSVLAFFSGAKYRVGFAAAEGSFLHDIPVPVREHATEVERNLDVLRHLGQPVTSGAVTVRVLADSVSRIDCLLSSYGISRNDPLIVIHPYGFRPTRAWFEERYAIVADTLAGWGTNIVFTGARKDTEGIESITHLMRNRALDFSGKLSIAELKGLLKRCDLVLTVDTGIMHLSVALGTRTVALFGPGDFGKWGYEVPHFTAVRKPVPCGPCYKFECDVNLGHRCMELITTTEVLETIKANLQRCNRFRGTVGRNLDAAPERLGSYDAVFVGGPAENPVDRERAASLDEGQ